MSLINRTIYLAYKVDRLKEKVQPHIDSVETTRNLGVEDLNNIEANIASLDAEILALENTEYKTKSEEKRLAKLRTKRSAAENKKTTFTNKLLTKKNNLLGKISNSVTKSADDVSGVTATVSTEPFTENGGGTLTFTPQPEAFDEVSTLLKNSIESPETMVTVTTAVTGVTSDGKAVTGQGVTPSGTIRTT